MHGVGLPVFLQEFRKLLWPLVKQFQTDTRDVLFLKLGPHDDFRDIGGNPVDNGTRRSGGRHQSESGAGIEVLQAGLGEGRYVGQ